MKLAFYLQWNIVASSSDAPSLIQGKDQWGNDCWFYISAVKPSTPVAQIPRILFRGKELFLREGNYEDIEEDMFTELHTGIKQDEIKTYAVGQEVTFEELARIFDRCNVNKLISNSTGVFYTINTNLNYEISFKNVTLSPYNSLVNNNQIVNFGSSSKYFGFDLLFFSDSNLVQREWQKILSGPLYEQICRGLSSSGNWEILSDSEYGAMFQVLSGWGKQKVCINNDKDINYSTINRDLENPQIVQAEIISSCHSLAKAIAPINYRQGEIQGAFRQYINFNKYDPLLKNAGVKIENRNKK